MPLRFALLFLAALLLYPQPCLAAARDAFALWQQNVAPSLLPFFALIPALTCPEATACFARLLRLPCRIWGVPQEFAGAVGVAFAAGSPAGARALMRIAAQKSHPADALFRTAMLCAGVSPGFLISGVGAGILGDPAAGMILLSAQMLALMLTAQILRLIPLPDAPVSIPKAEHAAEPSPIPYAINGVLAILAWMVLFSVLTRIGNLLLPAAGEYLPLIAEFSAGCAHAASLDLPREALLPLMGAVIGFGGVCAGCQNLSVLRPAGIAPGMYFAAKAIHASLCALCCRALMDVRLPALSFQPRNVLLALMAACLLPLFHKIMTPAAK